MFQRFFLILVFCISCFSAVADASYLDQTPPGDTPQLFAPGIVCNGFHNRDMAMMPDGSEFYFAVNMRNFDLSTIFSIHKTDDGWNGPHIPAFAREDKHFFFMSTRLPTDTGSDSETYSLDGLKRVFNSPENGNPDIYWVDAGFIEKLRPEGF